MRAALSSIIERDVRAASRRPMDALGGLVFFVAVGSLFPLAVGPDAELLRAIGPGVVWVAALLAVVISLHRLFQPDLDDGSLEQLLLSPRSLAGIVGAKMVAHWLVSLPAAGRGGALDGAAVRAAGAFDRRAAAVAAAGHADAGPAGRAGRGADAGPARPTCCWR